jgi:hypothetical protein
MEISFNFQNNMFTSNNPNIIVCDEGFSVQVLLRTGILYREGSKRICIGSEMLASPYGIAIYPSTIKKWDPPDNEEIGTTERKTILANVRRAFASQNIEIEVM